MENAGRIIAENGFILSGGDYSDKFF